MSPGDPPSISLLSRSVSGFSGQSNQFAVATHRPPLEIMQGQRFKCCFEGRTKVTFWTPARHPAPYPPPPTAVTEPSLRLCRALAFRPHCPRARVRRRSGGAVPQGHRAGEQRPVHRESRAGGRPRPAGRPPAQDRPHPSPHPSSPSQTLCLWQAFSMVYRTTSDF